MSIQSLILKSKTFNLSDNEIQKREQIRNEFLEKFPINTMPKLGINDYVVGNEKRNSFCYWLEYKNLLLGIGGSNASKYGLYAAEGHYFNKVGKNSKKLDTDETNEIFNNIRNSINLALDYASKKEMNDLFKINSPIANFVFLKIVNIYFPNLFINIGSRDVLKYCAYDLGVDEEIIRNGNLLEISYECRNIINSIPEFNSWHYEKIGSLIWQTYNNKGKRDYYILGSKIGKNNDKDISKEMYKNSVLSVGFSEDLDLTDLYGKPQNKIVEYLLSKNQSNSACNALKHFLNLKPGDRVAVKISGSPLNKKAFLSIFGIAEVIEDNGVVYKYNPDRLIHEINAKFIKGPSYKEFSIGGYGSTISKINKSNNMEKIIQIFESDYELIDFKSEQNQQNTYTPPPLNTILYGPPGTGKTYSSVQMAAQIVVKDTNLSFGEAREIFDGQLGDQIEFITFHQNYSYEDFIQGLRPKTDNGGVLEFSREDGVFKKIADKAKRNYEASRKSPETITKQLIFEKALDLFISEVQDSDGYYDITDNCHIFRIEEDAFRYTGKNLNNTNGILMKFSDLRTFHTHEVKERQDIKQLDDVSGLAKQHASYYLRVYLKIVELMKEVKTDQKTINLQNYVIIIDEINRANISRVFGELITLIEPDKRLGGKYQLSCTLPSGERFTVPPNLYIIGTMNTADKSIALLDIALRRRFCFQALYPIYQIDGKEINNAEILKKINEKIRVLKGASGHDFQIGHSYFMNDDSIEQIMNNRVIPLLMEYFMNDVEEVKAILQHAGLNVKKDSWPLEIENEND